MQQGFTSILWILKIDILLAQMSLEVAALINYPQKVIVNMNFEEILWLTIVVEINNFWESNFLKFKIRKNADLWLLYLPEIDIKIFAIM